ncbi:hypothetical protein CQS04_08280 [Chryseomicrobium excrementi]|uniref:RNA polymerase subunit sigma-24 n=1 Tax=Chryseomicrobium excrementi TaxID=2041346 RepID=A0A2M9F101_9BACL|nr:sigma-70 family RNA polymerase sigma factor [Chryseomicrobium excrementi]PJK17136.1 hypothetical protein CQS04_08280 [Chryseomicrobium excrementi]
MQFELLAEAYQPMISSILRKTSIYRDHELFRQTALIALWKAWENYEESKGSFAGYAYRSMYGAVLDELKKSTKDVPMEDSFFANASSVLPTQKFHELVIELPPLLQEVLLLSYYEGYTAEEISERIGLSVPGVKKRKKTALVKLRELAKFD